MYEDKEIPDELILHILENATWAPNHKLTEPWRFKIFKGESLKTLGEFLGEKYKANTTEETFSPVKYKKTVEKPLKCGCIIAVCMQADPDKRLPEEEEVLAMGAAVQNMWLSCSALGIGCYLSTPGAIHKLSELVTLEKGERCMGLFYMGWRKPGILESKRTSIAEKTSWI
jgi:nitroreductase